ncbi:MAG: hypothetical protein ACN4EH_05805, partial [Methyloceanibacter sp.]
MSGSAVAGLVSRRPCLQHGESAAERSVERCRVGPAGALVADQALEVGEAAAHPVVAHHALVPGPR